MSKEITYKNTKEIVKSRGYWKVVIEPTKGISNFFDHIRDARKVVESNRIQLRGWDYPHVQTNAENGNIRTLADNVNSFVNWSHFKEVWAYFNSGQFLHLLGFREDWFSESGWFTEQDPLSKLAPNSILDVVGATLTLTEILLFASNLSKYEKYNGQIILRISIHNLKGRQLQTISPRRFPLFFEYVADENDITLFDEIVSTSELDEKKLDIAKKVAVNLFKYFGTFDPPIHVIEEDQMKLIERRL
jgi:hypothetical protein